MSKKPDGGPAFPHDKYLKDKDGQWGTFASGGMTLRDWFAGQALAGMVGRVENDGSDFLRPGGPRASAEWAYAFADAMIAMGKREIVE